jgi:hypothetical protein
MRNSPWWAELGADALGGCGDRSLVGDVDLDGDGAGADLKRRRLAARKVARAEEDRYAIGDEFLGELKADALICPSDEGNTCVVHDISFLSRCGQPRRSALKQ